MPEINTHSPFEITSIEITSIEITSIEINAVAEGQGQVLTAPPRYVIDITDIVPIPPPAPPTPTNPYPVPHWPASRCFSLSGGDLTVMVEIRDGAYNESYRWLKQDTWFVKERCSWYIDDALSYCKSGSWVEITDIVHRGRPEPPMLFNIVTSPNVRYRSWMGTTDMHQGLGYVFDPAEPNPVLFPDNGDQRDRAKRFHSMWGHWHKVYQQRMNSRNHPGGRWDGYTREDVAARVVLNKKTAEDRRKWLDFPGRCSTDDKVRFRAWHNRLSTYTPTASVPWRWVVSKHEMYKCRTRLFDAKYEAEQKFNRMQWCHPDFALNHDGWYKENPWHFVHISKKDPTKIAYAKDWRALYSLLDAETSDENNAFTVTSPGKYLKAYYGDVLTDDQIRDIAADTIAAALPPVLHIAKTEQEIIKAIAEGPTESCMANGNYNGRTEYDWYKSPVHPAAVYAGSGDFEVLYVTNKHGEITARAITNAKKKLVARIYGDSVKLLAAMEGKGYQQAPGALAGCRLRRIEFEDGNKLVLPYVDAGVASGGGALFAYDNGEWLTVGHDGDFSTSDGYSNKGYTYIGEDQRHYCDDCGNALDEDDDVNSIEGEDITVCGDCLDEHFTNAIYGHRGYTRYFRNEQTIYCESDGENYRRNDASNYDIYQVEVGGRCQGKWYHTDDLVRVNGDWAHVESCTRLDEDIYGNEYVLDDDAVTTEDDKVIHEEDARTCVVTDAQYHWQSMVRIRRMEGSEMLFDGVQFCLSAIIDSPERFSVRYTVPFAQPELHIDSPDGIPIDQINWEEEEFSFRGFRNVVIGDFISKHDLHAALIEVYDNADHPEVEEVRLAA